RNEIADNAFYLLIGQTVSNILSIGLNAALGRNLGPVDFGVYFLLMSMSTFAYVLVDWGQSALLMREAVRSSDSVSTLLGSALAFRGIAVCVVVVLTAWSARLMGYAPHIQALAALVVVCGLPLALSQPYGFLFRGRNRMDLDAIVTVAAKVATVTATLAVL